MNEMTSNQKKKNIIRIMAVDDEGTLLVLMRKFLERSGYEVKTFNQGSDALVTLGEWIPDILLVDLQMPGMNGFEFLSTVNEQQLCPQSKIAVITGRNDPLDEGRVKSLGVHAFLYKPYKKEELLSVVKELSPVSDS